MSDEPLAGLMTAAVVAPLVILCCAGPAVVGSLIAGAAAWLVGFDPVAALVVGLLLCALCLFGLLRRRKRRDPDTEALMKGER